MPGVDPDKLERKWSLPRRSTLKGVSAKVGQPGTALARLTYQYLHPAGRRHVLVEASVW